MPFFTSGQDIFATPNQATGGVLSTPHIADAINSPTPTTSVTAAEIAERIRRSIDAVSFRPNGKACPLTVSVGGATFERQIPFSELFRIADQRLYDAKKAGRNRVKLTRVPPLAPELSTEMALSA